MKNLLKAIAIAAVLSLALGGSVLANCGKCPGDKAVKAAGCDKHQKACEDSMKALQDDLAKMEKAMTPDEQAAFLKAHKDNLKKFLDATTECKKACSVKGGKDATGCPHAEKEKKG